MSKKEKRELNIRENPSNVSLVDFEALINQYGYIKEGGSHPKAKIGGNTYPYKRENPIKQAYIKGILDLIDNLK